MLKLRNIFVLLAFIFYSFSLDAQSEIIKPADSLNSSIHDSLFTFVVFDNFFSSNLDKTVIDSTLFRFHRNDPVLRNDFIAPNNGNIGHPHFSFFILQDHPDFFSLGENRLMRYSYFYNQMPYYISSKAHSNIHYAIGPNEENYLDFTLGNQISKGLYYGIDLNYEGAKGIFNNQRSRNNHFRIVTKFNSRDNRYTLKFNYLRNKYNFQENGGLFNDFYYEDTTRLDRRILPVNLLSAENNLTSNHFFLNQYYSLTDTSEESGKLALELNYKTSNRLYTDNQPTIGYYQNYFIDSISSFDSTSSRSFNSFFGWQRKADLEGFSLRFGTSLNYNQFFTGDKLFVFNYLLPEFKIKYQSSKSIIKFSGEYRFFISGNSFSYNDHSFFVEGFLKREISKKSNGILRISFSNSAPFFQNYRTYSNHFIWINDFDLTQSLHLEGGYEYKGVFVKLNFNRKTNYVFFDENLLPIQFSDDLNIINASIQKHFKMNRFGSEVYASYQSSSDENIYPVPEIVARTNFYFSFPMFKKVLTVFPGIEATYVSSYFAPGYNPSSMIFFVQDEKKMEDQIYLDIYVNFRIKRARVFVIYKNINMLLGKYNYFLVAHYPQQDPGFRIGVSWNFID